MGNVHAIFIIIFSLNVFYFNFPFVTEISLIIPSFLYFASKCLAGPKIRGYNNILIILVLGFGSSLNSDFALAVLWSLLGFGISRASARVFFICTVCLLGALQVSIYKRLSFVYFDPNYSGYWLYLGTMPIFIQTLFSNTEIRSRVLNNFLKLNIVRFISGLTLSRSILLSFVVESAIRRGNHLRFLVSAVALFPFALIFYTTFFADRSGGSDSERLLIMSQILTGQVNVDHAIGFDGVLVWSPFRPPDYVVMLHNTLATWFYLIPIIFVPLAILIIFRGRFYLKFIYLLPLLFLSVSPGIFYTWGVASYLCSRRYCDKI